MPIGRTAMLDTLAGITDNERLVRESTRVHIGYSDRGYLAVEVTTLVPLDVVDGPRLSDDHCRALIGYPARQLKSITVTHETVEAVVYAVDVEGRRIMRADGSGYVTFRVFRPVQ